MQNRYIQLFICHVLLLVKLDAGVEVTGEVKSSSSPPRVVNKYFNGTNTVEIKIELTGDEPFIVPKFPAVKVYVCVFPVDVIVGFQPTPHIFLQVLVMVIVLVELKP